MQNRDPVWSKWELQNRDPFRSRLVFQNRDPGWSKWEMQKRDPVKRSGRCKTVILLGASETESVAKPWSCWEQLEFENWIMTLWGETAGLENCDPVKSATDHILVWVWSDWSFLGYIYRLYVSESPECDELAMNPGTCSQLENVHPLCRVIWLEAVLWTFLPFESISWWLSGDLRRWNICDIAKSDFTGRVCDFSPVWDVLHFFTFTYALLTGCLKSACFLQDVVMKLVGEPSHCWLIKTWDITTDDGTENVTLL